MQTPLENPPAEEFDPGNALASFRKITVSVLFAPGTFFQTMRTTGGMLNPVIYLAGCVLINTAIVGFLNKDVVLMIKSLALGIAFPFITAGILHFILTRFLGSRGTYEGALRVNAYAAAVNLVSWFPVVSILVELYRIYVITTGLRIVFGTTGRRAFLAVVLTIALLMLAALALSRFTSDP